MKLKILYFDKDVRGAELLDKNGKKYSIWDGCYLNLRRNYGGSENGRVSGIGPNGFDLWIGRQYQYTPYDSITNLWNIH